MVFNRDKNKDKMDKLNPPTPNKEVLKKSREINKKLLEYKNEAINKLDELREHIVIKRTREELERMTSEEVLDYYENALDFMIETQKQVTDGLAKAESLIEKQKGLLRSKEKLAEFREPVMLLIRRTGEIDIYEEVVGDSFEFEHSNEKIGHTKIELIKPYKFPYAGEKFNCYVAHEDWYSTEPYSPVVEARRIHDTVLSSNLALEKLKAKVEGMKMESWVFIAIAIAIVLFALTTWGKPFINEIIANIGKNRAAEEVPKKIAENITIFQ